MPIVIYLGSAGAVVFRIECLLFRGDGLAARCASWQDRPCTYNVTSWRVGVAIVVVEKRCYIFWTCVVALSVQHAMHVRHTGIRGLSRPTVFCHIFSQTAGFSGEKKGYWTRNVFWLSVQILSNTVLALRRVQRDIIINVRVSSCKVPGIFVIF